MPLRYPPAPRRGARTFPGACRGRETARGVAVWGRKTRRGRFLAEPAPNHAATEAMERAMRFELTTSTLARLRSTPELRPRSVVERGCIGRRGGGQAPVGRRGAARASRRGGGPGRAAEGACGTGAGRGRSSAGAPMGRPRAGRLAAADKRPAPSAQHSCGEGAACGGAPGAGSAPIRSSTDITASKPRPSGACGSTCPAEIRNA